MSSFTMTAHQIWSCHMTLAANFENFYFPPNSILNFRKSYQIWGKLAQEQKSCRQKANLGVETPPPVLIGLKGGTEILVTVFGGDSPFLRISIQFQERPW